jgi:hypothetical protein
VVPPSLPGARAPLEEIFGEQLPIPVAALSAVFRVGEL